MTAASGVAHRGWANIRLKFSGATAPQLIQPSKLRVDQVFNAAALFHIGSYGLGLHGISQRNSSGIAAGEGGVQLVADALAHPRLPRCIGQIGRASCREGGCQYVWNSV